jgi:hypothetical protein
MWFIELHHYKDEQPIFINFDKVATITASNEGGTLVVFEPNRRWVHVKEEYATIMQL